MLILKWGGDLTKLGERQAERLGERFTQAMYPDPRQARLLRSLPLFVYISISIPAYIA